MALSDGPSLLTLREVASVLRVSKAHVSKLINAKVRGVPALPAARLGRRVLIRRDALEEWLLLLDNTARFR